MMIIIALIVCSLVFLVGGIAAISVYASKMSKPIMKMANRMTLMAQGDLYTPIDNIDRTDEIGVLAYEFGGTLVSLKSYIRDIGEVLQELSRGNMLVTPQIEYDGDFASIDQSLRKIRKSLNHTFSEINKASGPGGIPGGIFGLVGMLLLLVQNDDSQILAGGKHGGPGAHNDPGLTGTHPLPLVVPVSFRCGSRRRDHQSNAIYKKDIKKDGVFF